MQIITDLSTWQNPYDGTIVAVGVFDGVHLGHRKVLDVGLEWARGKELPFGVVTFDRIPESVLGNRRPGLLISPEHRLGLLEEFGCDFALLVQFTRTFAGLTPRRFAEDILRDKLSARGVVMGYDQRFGKDRGGDVSTLDDLGASLGFEVRRAPAVRVEGEAVSSTRIRSAVESGRLEDAARMLGRPVGCRGTAHFLGDLTRRLRHSTYWLDLHHEVRPPCGVYAASIRVPDRAFPLILCNISTVRRSEHNPLSDDAERAVELCFETETSDLNGREVEILLLGMIRAEQPFPGDDAIRLQIGRDFNCLRDFSRNSSPPSP